MLLTFTNKASKEMISRLAKYFSEDILKNIKYGTFHSLSYKWLKGQNSKLILKKPSELKTLFKSIYEKVNFGRINSSIQAFSSQHIYEQYSFYQNITLGDFEDWFIEKYPKHEPLISAYSEIIKNFEKEKKDLNFLSFNDLLIEARKSFLENKMNIIEVLVDEYQDTNILQNSFIDSLKPKSIFCVGDYDQSIYAFNGASIENIENFRTKHKDSKLFTLNKNYRSSAKILALANLVIKNNLRIYPKKLEVTQFKTDFMPKVIPCDELFEQYQKISKMIKNSPYQKEDIAVLFRNNSSADGIEASLRELNIPTKRKGGNSFFESKEIKIIFDILSLITNPQDKIAFISIFEYGKNIGSAVAKDIFDSLSYFGEGKLIEGILNPTNFNLPKIKSTKNIILGLFDDDIKIGSTSRFAHMKLSNSIKNHPILKYPKLTEEGLKFFVLFYSLVKNIKSIYNPSSFLKVLVDSHFYKEIINILSNQRAKLSSGEMDKIKKKESIDKIYIKAQLLINLSNPYRIIGNFINAIILGGGEVTEGSGVNLLTIHASKGLEFKEVYILDLMEDRFPNNKLIKKSGSLEEERRLFYVAVTRAKEKLYLSFARYDKLKKTSFKPSIFLKEGKLVD